MLPNIFPQSQQQLFPIQKYNPNLISPTCALCSRHRERERGERGYFDHRYRGLSMRLSLTFLLFYVQLNSSTKTICTPCVHPVLTVGTLGYVQYYGRIYESWNEINFCVHFVVLVGWYMSAIYCTHVRLESK